MRDKYFTVTEDHLKLLRRMYIGWEDCEYGAPAVDCKRPYGNSSVSQDIAEILGWEFDRDYDFPEDLYDAARAIHKEMQTVLQILVSNLTIEPGDYTAMEYGTDWTRHG